jgi:serine/threonine protein kinase
VDRLLGRDVVVHIPYRSADDEPFLQLARLRARLRHANLVPIYDLGSTSEGKPLFTEPYFHSTDLRQLQHDPSDKTTVGTLVRLVSHLVDACKALSFLHANGFLHLDMRPGSVLVAPQFQEVFVVGGRYCPFPVRGTEKAADAGSQGTMLGAPVYIAPEQLDPERLGVPDVRTDVYGLGGILFEILYDSPPMGKAASFGEILTALLRRKGPPKPGTLGTQAGRYRELARKLEPVCLRALESDRAPRQENVPAFMSEVEQCAWGWASSQHAAPGPGCPTRATR